MTKEYGIYAAIAALLIIALSALWWQGSNPSGVVPGQATPSTNTATSSATTTPAAPANTSASQAGTGTAPAPAPRPPRATQTAYQFSLVPGETVASWTFAGSYKDGGTLEARVNAEIARLKRLLGGGTYTDYELYVSIANQYDLLGDGRQEFTYLNYALAIDSTKTGLAWHNMGKLLERLGAYKSARVAYDRMAQAQSTAQYIRARLEFLRAHMPEDTDAIAQAQADLNAATW